MWIGKWIFALAHLFHPVSAARFFSPGCFSRERGSGVVCVVNPRSALRPNCSTHFPSRPPSPPPTPLSDTDRTTTAQHAHIPQITAAFPLACRTTHMPTDKGHAAPLLAVFADPSQARARRRSRSASKHRTNQPANPPFSGQRWFAALLLLCCLLSTAATASYVSTPLVNTGGAGDLYGQSVASSGSVVAVGAPQCNFSAGPGFTGAGYVALFSCGAGACTYASVVPSTASQACFGMSVALLNSGAILLVGAPTYGQVFFFFFFFLVVSHAYVQKIGPMVPLSTMP